MAAAGLLDVSGNDDAAASQLNRDHGFDLTAADVGGAFIASLSSHRASTLAFDGFVEALLRLAAASGEASAKGQPAATTAAAATAAARTAAAAAVVASPSRSFVMQRITALDTLRCWDDWRHPRKDAPGRA